LAYAVVAQEFGWPRHASWRHMIDGLFSLSDEFDTLVVRAKSLLAEHVNATFVVLDRDGRSWGCPFGVGVSYEDIRLRLADFKPVSAFRVPYTYPPSVTERVLPGLPRDGGLKASDIASLQVGVVDEAGEVKTPVGLAVSRIRLEKTPSPATR
jgi:hypothetical protein